MYVVRLIVESVPFRPMKGRHNYIQLANDITTGRGTLAASIPSPSLIIYVWWECWAVIWDEVTIQRPHPVTLQCLAVWTFWQTLTDFGRLAGGENGVKRRDQRRDQRRGMAGQASTIQHSKEQRTEFVQNVSTEARSEETTSFYVLRTSSNQFTDIADACTGERGASWASLEFIDGRSLRCWNAEWIPRSNGGWRERWRLGWRLGRNGRRRELWSWPFGRGIWLLTWGCWGCQRKFDNGAM